jgi:hypothetical protein
MRYCKSRNIIFLQIEKFFLLYYIQEEGRAVRKLFREMRRIGKPLGNLAKSTKKVNIFMISNICIMYKKNKFCNI